MNTEIKSKVCSKCKEEKALEEFNKCKKSKYGRQPKCKLCRKAYRIANRDNISKYQKNYYQEKRDDCLRNNKIWREENKEKISISRKKYREENKESIRLKHKIWRDNNKEKISLKGKVYYRNNKKEICEYQKEYRQANKERHVEYKKAYSRKRYAEDPVFRTMRTLRRQTSRLGDYKSSSTIQIVGCSPQEFWKRNGSPSVEQMEDLHIDHIVPLSWFDLSNEDHVAVSSHHSNLQYLSSEDNMAKGSSYAGTPDNVIAYKDNLDIEAYVTDMLALINIL